MAYTVHDYIRDTWGDQGTDDLGGPSYKYEDGGYSVDDYIRDTWGDPGEGVGQITAPEYAPLTAQGYQSDPELAMARRYEITAPTWMRDTSPESSYLREWDAWNAKPTKEHESRETLDRETRETRASREKGQTPAEA